MDVKRCPSTLYGAVKGNATLASRRRKDQTDLRVRKLNKELRDEIQRRRRLEDEVKRLDEQMEKVRNKDKKDDKVVEDMRKTIALMKSNQDEILQKIPSLSALNLNQSTMIDALVQERQGCDYAGVIDLHP